MRNFAGKTAFVTGGASGIGLGISKALLSEGMNVVIGDVNEGHMAEARSELGDANVSFVHIDVTDRQSVAAAAAAIAAFGPIHVLCNNAGIAGGGAVADPGFADWDRAMAVNLGGAVNVVKTFVPLIREHGSGGHIVNTAPTPVSRRCPMKVALTPRPSSRYAVSANHCACRVRAWPA